jgi:heme exporter protein D
VTDFLSMGGYAAYVWPAVGFAACVLLGLLGQSWWIVRRREAEFDRLRAAAAAAAGRSSGPTAAGAGPPPVRRRTAVRVRTAAAEAPGGTEPAATARD